MAASSARPAGVLTPALALLLPLCVGPGGISGSNLKPMLQKGEAPAPPTTPVAVPESRAKEFLAALPVLGLRRGGSTVQFICPGSTSGHIHQIKEKACLSSPTPSRGPGTGQPAAELRREILLPRSESDDITYWLNRGRNGHDYYDYHRRHDDEDAAIGPRSPHGFRHGASVNYHDY
ncbi:augurin [Kogia breviceps]|uniref:augurin n=1 Tax=Kogia breviceps TaxID=27615 RepID=UPI0034D26DEF